MEQEVISPINDFYKKWSDADFVHHFYLGGGKTKTLEEIGLLGAVINHAKEIMFDNVLKQVTDEARLVKSGRVVGLWDNSYSFGEVVFSFGGAKIKGRFAGAVKQEEKILIVTARAEYEFSDTFTDPTNIRQNKIGSSALEDIPYDASKPSWDRDNIIAGLIWLDSDYGGTPYDVVGRWVTEITGSVSVE